MTSDFPGCIECSHIGNPARSTVTLPPSMHERISFFDSNVSAYDNQVVTVGAGNGARTPGLIVVSQRQTRRPPPTRRDRIVTVEDDDEDGGDRGGRALPPRRPPP